MRSPLVETLETHVASGADEVWVQLGSAQLHGPNGWTEAESVPLEVDLRTLRNGGTATFRIVDAPPGAYDRIRLDVSDAWAISGGEKLAIASSFAGWSWIEIDYDLTVPDCGPITIVIEISIEWKNGWPYIHVFIDLVGGECDAGLPDAGVPDAAEPDAALPDAAVDDRIDADVSEAALFRVTSDDIDLYALSSGNVLAYGSGTGTVVTPDGEVVSDVLPDPGHRVAVWVPPAAEALPDIIVGAYEALIGMEANGEEAWRWNPFGCCNTMRIPAAVDPATERVYFAGEQRVFQRDARTGGSEGFTDLYGALEGYVALAPGLLWKAGTDGRVSLSDRPDTLWSATTRFTVQLGIGTLGAPALASDGSLIVGSGGDVRADRNEPGPLAHVSLDGQISWEIDARAVTAPVIGAGDVTFVGSAPAEGGYRVDAYSLAGALLWSAQLAQRPTDLVVGDDGLVYVAAGTEILGFDQATGSQELRYYGLTGAQQLLLQSGVLYVSDTGALYALPVEATGLDPAAPWPARFHDNQRTSSL